MVTRVILVFLFSRRQICPSAHSRCAAIQLNVALQPLIQVPGVGSEGSREPVLRLLVF
jgi:hypothetical protein